MVSWMGNVSLGRDTSPLPQNPGPTAGTATMMKTAGGAATRGTTGEPGSSGACLEPRQGSASGSSHGQDTGANKKAARPATIAGTTKLTTPRTPLQLWKPQSRGDAPGKGPPATAEAEHDAPLHAANPKRPPTSRDDAATKGSTLRAQTDTTMGPQGCLPQQFLTHLPLNHLLCAGTSRRTGRRPWRRHHLNSIRPL